MKVLKHSIDDRSVIHICNMNSEVMTRGEVTRQIIIERSAPIFMTKGIAATTMSNIMEATSLSAGNFKNKEELAEAAVQYNLTF